MRWSMILRPLFAFLFLVVSAQSDLGGILCRLQKNVGFECGASRPHAAFHFDVDVGECLEFVFNGCGGNPNRFQTKEECLDGCDSLLKCGKGLPLMDFAGNIKRCEGERVPCSGGYECVGHGMKSVCCRKADRICEMSVDPGSHCGVPAKTHFYFDKVSNLCRPFAFSGCGGNENNFVTKGECMRYCASEVTCLKGDPQPDRYSASRIARCHNDSDCASNYTCTGRGPRKACCPSKDYVCGLPYNTRSTCSTKLSHSVFTFDIKKGRCEQLDTGGCLDQLNSFASVEQCSDYCIGVCPGNLETFLNPSNSQPQLCNSKKNEGCPLGFECLKTRSYASVCCKTEPICPNPESLVLTEGGGVAKRCSPELDSECPVGYSCQQAKNLEHICCTLPLECPYGMQTLREQFSRPKICSPGVEGSCPVNSLCLSGMAGIVGTFAKNVCCRPNKKCMVPHVDKVKKRPQKCLPGDNRCPQGTQCLEAVDENDLFNVTVKHYLFLCCYEVDVFACADGMMPILHPATNKPQRCNPLDPRACPEEYICDSMIDGSHSCCPNRAIAQKPCTEVLLDHKEQIVECLGWDDNETCQDLPRGKCRKASDQKYYCCKE
ncbi:hypothetical protein L596_018644 [Steinernema carpocapsae]|uniref:BPTI/Kunitz inhibitor domain-containing protein n=1 Tax=Steinernema carpocapsae TaxID=34508 RepID=A0A4U5N588_STECR|nr:hypothetical protein L596_018644 [Steinernema carpocapsae]